MNNQRKIEIIAHKMGWSADSFAWYENLSSERPVRMAHSEYLTPAGAVAVRAALRNQEWFVTIWTDPEGYGCRILDDISGIVLAVGSSDNEQDATRDGAAAFWGEENE